MAVVSGVSIQTKADKDPGLVYAYLVYQRASDCQVNPDIDKTACLSMLVTYCDYSIIEQ